MLWLHIAFGINHNLACLSAHSDRTLVHGHCRYHVQWVVVTQEQSKLGVNALATLLIIDFWTSSFGFRRLILWQRIFLREVYILRI